MTISAFAWVDRANVPGVLDWWAFVLGGLGIGFTIWQLLRSRSALDAARNALNETQSLLVANQALFALPVFQEISDSIDLALSEESRTDLQRAFGRFAIRASEISSLLRALDRAEYQNIVDRLDDVSAEVGASRANLFASPDETCHTLGGEAASSVRELAISLNGLAVTIKNDPGVRNANA
jgi:hypothetical protein